MCTNGIDARASVKRRAPRQREPPGETDARTDGRTERERERERADANPTTKERLRGDADDDAPRPRTRDASDEGRSEEDAAAATRAESVLRLNTTRDTTKDERYDEGGR